MHPFIKEMHTRVCLSIQKFCIFFDFKDVCIYDRKENRQHTLISRTNKILLQLFPRPSKQKFTLSISSYQKLHIRSLQFLQPIINPFSRICLNSSTSPVSSHEEHSTMQESSQNLQAILLAKYKNQTCQFRESKTSAFSCSTISRTQEQSSNFTCSCQLQTDPYFLPKQTKVHENLRENVPKVIFSSLVPLL